MTLPRIVALLFLLAVIAPRLSVAQGSLAADLESALRAYESGDFEAAIATYERLIEEAYVHDSGVYFNLGSAYFEAGDIARALLNFRRAQALTPRDADLTTNIAVIRAQRLDLQEDESAPIDGMALLTEGVLTLREFGWLMLLLWAAWFILLLSALLRRSTRDVLRAPIVVAGIALLVALILFGSRVYVTHYRPSAVVLEDRTPVMSGPGEQYLEMFAVNAAAEIRILETREGWLRFQLPDGRQGWLPPGAAERV